MGIIIHMGATRWCNFERVLRIEWFPLRSSWVNTTCKIATRFGKNRWAHELHSRRFRWSLSKLYQHVVFYRFWSIFNLCYTKLHPSPKCTFFLYVRFQNCTFLRMILKVFDSFDFSIFKLKTKFKTFLESSRIGGFANSPFEISSFTSKPPFWIKYKRFSSESVYGTFRDMLYHLVKYSL